MLAQLYACMWVNHVEFHNLCYSMIESAIMYAQNVSLNRFELVPAHMTIYAWIMLVSQFVFPHDWVMDECLQSYMLKYVHMSESCVIEWLSNGWMPAIMNT
jgi:hypothetical protein